MIFKKINRNERKRKEMNVNQKFRVKMSKMYSTVSQQ